ncbi:hypothetical protein PUNSTDRAFT_130498 [Punctularia strigosozonata HHB-11173 SS5]|uniref:uncharacterized protein n=1 Tax=Punctularia strigosozonata (strain HHB-11173) TaxID=741275 RepID=UPI0004417E0A|nr:uncharacterized protein PUNSTDRAFT_130498 [Punctularia strigosozonata HHB-11173 SS5]EIN12229.1 hypothetical protein PUNSTDRAFT_130498 [Punctularia strigosozonata HHB-11173 SS5]
MAVRKKIGDEFRKLRSPPDNARDEGASSQPLDLATGTIGAMDVDEPQATGTSQPHQRTNDIGSPQDDLTKHSGRAIAEAGGYRSSEQTVARRAIDEAKKEVATMQSDTLVERGAAAVDERKDLAQGLASSPKQWESLFRRLKQFTELVDRLPR